MKYQRNRYKILSFFIFFICCIVNTNAQLVSAKNTETDTELWTGLDFSKEITKKVSLSFAYQTRLRENISIIRSNFGQIGLSFPLLKNNKKLKAATSLRVNRTESVKWIIRPIIDIGYSLFKNDFVSINYRIRFQKDFENRASESSKNFIFFNELYWRNRLVIEYRDFKDFEPFIGFALFKNIERQYITIDQFRFITGFSYKVNKKHSLKLSYIYREKFNIKNHGVNHIISAKFYFEIKDFKKKNKKGNLKEKEKKNGEKAEQKKKETKKLPRSKPLGPHRIEP